MGFSADNSSITLSEGGPAQTVCVDVKPEGLSLDPFDRVPINLRVDPGAKNCINTYYCPTTFQLLSLVLLPTLTIDNTILAGSNWDVSYTMHVRLGISHEIPKVTCKMSITTKITFILTHS